MLHRVLAAAVSTIALTQIASAANIPVKAPPPAPPPVFSWTGLYWGLNVGGSFGEARTDWNYFAPNLVTGATVCGFAVTCISGSDTVNMDGPIGGVQAGYNWQGGNFLAGIETDFQGSGQSGRRDVSIPFNPGSGFGLTDTAGTVGVSITENIEWLGTVRGRVGYVADRLLFYVTGGLAYGRVTVDSSASATGFFTGIPGAIPCPSGGPCPVWNFSSSGVTKTGWTVGAGVEGAVGGNWTVKLEYLFIDLGTVDTTFTGIPGCFGSATHCGVEAAGVGAISSRITDNIVRLGLNYKFGGPY